MTEFQPVPSQPDIADQTAKIKQAGHSQNELDHEPGLKISKIVFKAAMEKEYPIEVPLCAQWPEQLPEKPNQETLGEIKNPFDMKTGDREPITDTGENTPAQPALETGAAGGELTVSGNGTPDTEEIAPDTGGTGGDQVTSDTGGGSREPAYYYAGNEPWAELFVQAVKLHKQGIEGDKDAVREAHKILEQLREKNPENALVEAYYGSATSLLGRDAVNPMERFNKAIRGLKILDSVVAREPENTEIRTLRAYVCYRLPENFFHRTGTAVEDLSWLAGHYDSNPGAFSQDFYCQILFDLGASYKRLGQDQKAGSTWQKLLSLTQNPKYIDLLRAEGFHPACLIPARDAGQKARPQNGETEKLLAEGIALRELALKGDTGASHKAFSFFKKAMAANPDNPLVKAYYADCMSLAARDSADPGEMFSTPIKASKIMDSAVNSSPDDVSIRMIRAYHSFRLPEAFFRRTAPALADFEYLVQAYEKDRSVFPADTYFQLLYDLSLAYRRLGLEEEASATREKLRSLNPGPKFRAMLDENSGHQPVRRPLEELTPDNREAFYEEGFRLHDLGVAGNREAAKASLELWQKAYETNPGDTLARAYYGSSMALVGRDSTEPNAIFGNAIKGLVHLNRAISRDRNNPRIRLLRAYLAYSLPEVFFHQTKRAIKDFRFLKMLCEQENSVFPRERYHKILYDLGMAYQRTGDDERAKKTWAKLLKENPDSRYKTMLAERMGTGSEDQSQENN